MLVVLGIVMMAYTGFNYVTKEKVVDLGPIEISKEKNNPVSWSPIIGVCCSLAASSSLHEARRWALKNFTF